MKSRFGKSKDYIFGKLTDIRAGEIRIVRFFGKAIYERCGPTERLFGFIRDSNNPVVEKLVSSLVVFILAVPVFVFMFFLVFWYIWKPKSEC